MRGSVIKRGKRWYVIIEQRDPATGERRRKWHSGFATRAGADQARTELLSRIQQGTYIPPSKRTVRSFLLDEWLPAIRGSVRESTHQSYEATIRNHIAPHLGSVYLQGLTPAKINSFYADLSRRRPVPLAPKTVRNSHGVLHKAFSDAARWGYVTRNPVSLANPPRLDGGRPIQTWSVDELRAFLAFAEEDRLFAAWQLLATTGMRRGEVLGLRWEDVDLNRQNLSVRQSLVSVSYQLRFEPPKTSKGNRSVALDRRTSARLIEHRRRQAEERLAAGPAYQSQDLVFCRENGSPFHPDLFSQRFRRLIQQSGLPKIRLHDLRHTHATIALQSGTHPKIISERLGHSTVSFTLDTYSHVLPSLQDRFAEDFSNLVFDRPVENR